LKYETIVGFLYKYYMETKNKFDISIILYVTIMIIVFTLGVQ